MSEARPYMVINTDEKGYIHVLRGDGPNGWYVGQSVVDALESELAAERAAREKAEAALGASEAVRKAMAKHDGERIEALRAEIGALNTEIAQTRDKWEQAERERDEAREALAGWEKWASTSRCIYCDEEFHHSAQDQTEADDAKKAHILVCPKHPLGHVTRERDEARALLERLAARADFDPQEPAQEWMAWALDEIDAHLRGEADHAED